MHLLWANSTLTREHVFPRWLRQCFPDVEEVDYLRRFVARDGDEAVHERPGVLCDLTVRDVCERCDTGWMHELEEAARPVLLISPTTGASVRWPPPEWLATDMELEALSRRLPGTPE